MHAAPPVQVALPRSSGWRSLQAAAYGLAAAALAMWALGSVVAAALAAAAGAGVAWCLVPAPHGALVWDGAQWQFRGQACDVTPAIDAGRWLLLRLTPAAGRRSLWAGLGARTAGPAWHGFRCAVYCPRPTPHETDDLPDSEPPPAARTPP